MKAENRPGLGTRTWRGHSTLFSANLEPIQRSTVLLEHHAEGRRQRSVVCNLFLLVQAQVLDIAFGSIVLVNVIDWVENVELSGDVEAHLHGADGLRRITLLRSHVRERSHHDFGINDAFVGLVQEALDVDPFVLLIVYRLRDVRTGFTEYSVYDSIIRNRQSLGNR
jgi:hypothetical protein